MDDSLLHTDIKARYAVIVLHEIYGINEYIKETCRDYYCRGFDVYCPNLSGRVVPFDYTEQADAYRAFTRQGFEKKADQVNELSRRLRPSYEKIILAGSSVGATLAWLAAGTAGLYDGLIGCYGSRIRDCLHLQSGCPALLIFARREASFCPQDILPELENKTGLTAVILEGEHGFMDRYGNSYHAVSADKAGHLIQQFLRSVIEEV